MSTLAVRLPARRDPSAPGRLAAARRRWTAMTEPPRIIGLDLARSLAVVGMAGAHLALVGDKDALIDPLRPATWHAVVHGRPSMLFALLAGVSMAVLSGGRRPPVDGDALRRLRLRLAGRGVGVFAIGVGADLLGTPVAVVLGLYGVLFVIAPLFVTWSPRRLLVTAVALAVVGPIGVATLHLLTLYAGGSTTGVVLGYFPITAWLVPVFVGLAIGRFGVTDPQVLRIVVAAGAVLTVAGEAAGRLAAGGLLGAGVAADLAPGAPEPPHRVVGSLDYLDRLHSMGPARQVISDWVSVVPHSGGTPDVVSSTGTALLVLAGCVLLGQRLGRARRLLVPLAALGTMPLTGYVAHLLVIVVAMGGPRGDLDRSPVLWAATTAALLVGSCAWAVLVGRGPLERWVGRVADRFAG